MLFLVYWSLWRLKLRRCKFTVNYQESLDWLYGTQHFGVKLGLDAAKQLMRKFLAFPSYSTKVLHVAGTNGKGSTCAMIEMLIRGGGYRTALFTSPHLVHFRERIKVNSVMISEDACAKYLTELKTKPARISTNMVTTVRTSTCKVRRSPNSWECRKS